MANQRRCGATTAKAPETDAGGDLKRARARQTTERPAVPDVGPAGASAALDVAVLVPCYNEARSIGKVVQDFHAALPGATIYVYDNNSSDGTAEIARAAGAQVFQEPHQGKGFVVRRMFTDIDADVYVLVDGDATYDAPSARRMIDRLLSERLDMVVGARIDQEVAAYRAGHRAGNRLLTGFVANAFGNVFTDILSGYRVFSRRFVKSFPVLSGGFEIETELTVHALELDLPVGEVETPYYARLAGSASKLNTWRDGFRILLTIFNLYRSERPLPFFAGLAAALAIVSIGLAIPIFVTFIHTGLVPRLPTAVLSTGLMLLAFLSFSVGMVLDTVTRGRREAKLFAYLAQRAPGQNRRRPAAARGKR
jgi:glycosyltransferase involved in cell wall biosynthesis